jgi:hypothetical protein
MKGGRVRGVEAEGAESEEESQWGRVGGVDAEGVESEGENQSGPSQRGRCGGGRLLRAHPSPLTTGRMYRLSLCKKRAFLYDKASINRIYRPSFRVHKFGHRTVKFYHKRFD